MRSLSSRGTKATTSTLLTQERSRCLSTAKKSLPLARVSCFSNHVGFWPFCNANFWLIQIWSGPRPTLSDPVGKVEPFLVRWELRRVGPHLRDAPCRHRQSRRRNRCQIMGHWPRFVQKDPHGVNHQETKDVRRIPVQSIHPRWVAQKTIYLTWRLMNLVSE